MIGPHRQRGVALLAAILLVAIGTILAASIAFQNAMAARRGIASLSFEQSVLAAQAAEAAAAGILRDDGAQTDDFSDSWAQRLPPTEVVPGVMLEAWLEDLQGRFNLNSLVTSTGEIDQEALDSFRRLLEALEIEPKWADQLADWIDPNLEPHGFDGLEDGGTTNQQPPYRTANTIITSTSELLALPGFGRERYLKLAPFVAALPPESPLNVCTASGIVLDAMVDEGYREYSVDPEALANSRKKECFPKLEQYTIDLLGERHVTDEAQGRLIKSHFGKSSKYFRLTSLITLGGSEFALYSLLQRGQGGSAGQGKVRVVQRSFTPD